LFKFALIISLFVLGAGVFRFSIIRKSYFREIATNNKVVEKNIPAVRGRILDRKGRLIAKSWYQYYKMDGENKIFNQLGDFNGNKFEGMDLAYEVKREYFYKASLGLVSGYVNDGGGKGGVEQFMEGLLKGTDGKRLIEIDATGKYIRELGRKEPVSGQDVELSIDAYWQDKIYKLVEGKKVVVIMSEPKTGKIIVMVSAPSMDPNYFSFNRDNKIITEYLNDYDKLPMLNRVINARYHPGSTFKPVLASAGLESKVIDKDTLLEDTGVIKVGDYSYANWLWTKSHTTDGMLNIVKALQRSNDVYFYRLGEKLGVDRIKTWAEKFGYGNKTGVELPGELAGIVPDETWKKKTKGENWYLGNTYHLSIGQGDLSVTPLQVNQMTNIVANNGKKCQMSILKNSVVKCENIGIKQETIDIVKEGMGKACATGGTAWPLFNFKTKLACKTGTAEVGDGTKDTHAWLTAFAPADDPQISITVLVERGGEGSDVAAPIVGDILKEWFEEPETVVPRK